MLFITSVPVSTHCSDPFITDEEYTLPLRQSSV